MIVTKISDYPDLMTDPTAESIQEVLGNRAGGIVNHSVAFITLKPGKASKQHYHKVSSESYLILKGIGSLEIDGNQFDLNPGEAVLIQPLEVHKIINNSPEELVFLAVCVPAWYPQDSFQTEK